MIRPPGFGLPPLLLRQTRPRTASTHLRSWVAENSSRVSSPPALRLVVSRRYIQTQVFWLPPLMFVGLLGSLWVWKCLMMIVFQNKIIYMPGMPPNARSERIADYARQCGGVAWEERRIRAADGTDLALCVASVEVAATGPAASTSPAASAARRATPVYILYFQGPPCVPPSLHFLSSLARLHDSQETPRRCPRVCRISPGSCGTCRRGSRTRGTPWSA